MASSQLRSYTIEDTFPVPDSDEDPKHDWGNLPFNLRANSRILPNLVNTGGGLKPGAAPRAAQV